ncbi:MAG: caspase family protein [Pseudomonadota bacterium]
MTAYQWRRALLVFCCVFIQSELAGAKQIALVIGNARYVNEKPLRNPANDARLIADTLRKDLGFDTVIEKFDLDRRGLIDAITNLEQIAGDSDTIVVYYSGHGMQGPGGNYLIPVDARINEAAHVRVEGIAASDIMDVLKNSQARVGLLILDACRDNPFMTRTKSTSKGLQRMTVEGGRLLLAYATQEGDTADDGSGNNSPYALALATNLKRRELRLLEVFDAVAVDVKRQTGTQRPTRYGDLPVNVYLMGKPAQLPNASAEIDAEQVLWDEVKGAGRRDYLDAYLAQYPNGTHAAPARDLLAKQQARAVAQEAARPVPGSVFKECPECPDMVVVPAKGAIAVFAMGQSEVTQAQWLALMGNNPSHYKGRGMQAPVERISWTDAQEFIKKLNAATGKTYRLPSEREWEHACLAGKDTDFCGGNDASEVGCIIGFWPVFSPELVKQRKANAFGLFDMTGNVEEWTDSCSMGDCKQRIVRGGHFMQEAKNALASTRRADSDSVRYFTRGFRVARSLP